LGIFAKSAGGTFKNEYPPSRGDDTKVSELFGQENQTWTNLGPEREFAPIERVKDTAGTSGRRYKVKSVRLIA
jgi:hypothetical protein